GLFARALFRQLGFGIGRRLVGRILAPLAVEVHAWIAPVVRWFSRTLILTLEALERGPGFDQGAVHRKVLVAGQPELAGFRYHGAEKLARHIVLKQPCPITAKAGVVEARFVPVQIQEPAEQQVIIQLLAEHSLAAHCIKRHQQRGFQQSLRRDRGPAYLTVHLLEQRREFFERYPSQRLDQSNRMVGWYPLLRVNHCQHRSLWPIMSTHLPLPPQPNCPRSTIQMQNHPSIPIQQEFLNTLLGPQPKNLWKNGCRLDQHHHLQAARPSSIEPGPQQAVALTKPRSTGPLPMENSHLMSEGQHLQFQGGP